MECPNCRKLAQRIAELEKRLAEALAEIEQLKAKVAAEKKDSTTSSKPPSSDIVKPRKPPKQKGSKRKRRRGGQPGHQRHTRPLFPPEEVDKTWIYELADADPKWQPLDEYRILQQVELPEKLFTITEFRARMYRNRETGQTMYAPLPEEVVRGGLLGPRLTALIGYQKGACHMSYTSIERFFGDVLDLKVSRGELAKVIGKMSAALAPSYEQLQDALPSQPVLNIDETGHPECGNKLWNWGFHAPGTTGFTWFHIDPSRACDVLKQFLTETFQGIIGCDYYSAYRKFLHETDARIQFCWAHLIRDVKFLTTLSDKATKRYGEKLLREIKGLFRVWHRRDELSAERWTREAEKARQAVLHCLRYVPQRTEAQNVADRFRKHRNEYFLFLEVKGVEPTNNAMERQFRQIVIDRKITQGTRGESGRRWSERIWTAVTTCGQQGRSAFAFLAVSIRAHFAGDAAPSLLATPPL
jgi:transposase